MDNPEGSVEVEATPIPTSPSLKRAKKASAAEGASSECQVADSFWHKDFDFRRYVDCCFGDCFVFNFVWRAHFYVTLYVVCRFMEEKVPLAEVDVQAGMKAKFGDLVMDAGMSALRVLLMGNVMEKKHELLEAKHKDAAEDVEKWKHKATGLEARLSVALKEKKASDKVAEDAKKAQEAAEAEREKLKASLAAMQVELEASRGELALYFDNGFERAKDQVLLFNPDAKLEELDPFKVIVNGELVEEVEEEIEE